MNEDEEESDGLEPNQFPLRALFGIMTWFAILTWLLKDMFPWRTGIAILAAAILGAIVFTVPIWLVTRPMK